MKTERNNKVYRIRKPDDWHVHLRQEEALQAVAKYTARNFRQALVMPNTKPAIETAEQAMEYQLEIMKALEGLGDFTPFMTIKLAKRTTPSIISEAASAGVMAAKLYPEGVTTNSSDGIMDFRLLDEVFAAMAEVDMVLSIHGELPGVPILRRERAFLPIVHEIAHRFPKLRIVLEHLSTAKAVAVVEMMPANVAATITVHHMMLTCDDVIGGKMRPHNFCLPIVKSERDRRALIEAATSGNPKFFFGSDSAPHSRFDKESAEGPGGIFNPYALELLMEVFDEANAVKQLQDFTSCFGAEFYRVPLNEEFVEMATYNRAIPEEIDGFVPFMAGRELKWRVKC